MTIQAVARGAAVVLVTAVAAACGGDTVPPSSAGLRGATTPAVAETAPRRPVASSPLPGDRVAEILELTLDPNIDPALLRAALDEIVVHHDQRFVAVLIELIDAGAGRRAAFHPSVIEALHELTGQSFGRVWDLWAAWYGKTSLEPPPGFATWKARTLAPFDPRFADFLYDGPPHTIRLEEIVWGGVPVDGIAPLDNPPALAASEATYLDPGEPVFGVVVNGEARAYPLRIMDAHELANDVVGGRPLSLVYCTLCGTGIAYDTRLDDGTVLTFSTSGLLHQSNKLMYDRATKSLWQQFTGRPVVGPLVASSGVRVLQLRPLPTVVSSWRDWRAAHPETTVLSLETGRGRGYTLGYPYLEYFSSGEPIFPLAQRSTLLPAKTWVYGLSIEGNGRAYPLGDLARNRVTNDQLGGAEIVLVAPHAVIDVEAEAAVVGILSYEAGGTVRAYERPRGVRFAPGDSADVLVDERGASWRVTEDGLVGPAGELAPRVVGTLSFWFGWFSFHPQTEVFTQAR